MKRSKPTTKTHEILTESQVKAELEIAVEMAGGVNALARLARISAEPIVRARRPGGNIYPVVLKILNLKRRDVTYERIRKGGR